MGPLSLASGPRVVAPSGGCGNLEGGVTSEKPPPPGRSGGRGPSHLRRCHLLLSPLCGDHCREGLYNLGQSSKICFHQMTELDLCKSPQLPGSHPKPGLQIQPLVWKEQDHTGGLWPGLGTPVNTSGQKSQLPETLVRIDSDSGMFSLNPGWESFRISATLHPWGFVGQQQTQRMSLSQPAVLLRKVGTPRAP